MWASIAKSILCQATIVVAGQLVRASNALPRARVSKEVFVDLLLAKLWTRLRIRRGCICAAEFRHLHAARHGTRGYAVFKDSEQRIRPYEVRRGITNSRPTAIKYNSCGTIRSTRRSARTILFRVRHFSIYISNARTMRYCHASRRFSGFSVPGNLHGELSPHIGTKGTLIGCHRWTGL
jgi:hypothetical protein